MRHISDKLATADRDEDDNDEDGDGEDDDVVDNYEDDNMEMMLRMAMRKSFNILRNECLGLQNNIKRYYLYCLLFTNSGC